MKKKNTKKPLNKMNEKKGQKNIQGKSTTQKEEKQRDILEELNDETPALN